MQKLHENNSCEEFRSIVSYCFKDFLTSENSLGECLILQATIYS